MFQKKTYELELGGKTIKAEFNNIAEQAEGSVLLSSGTTVVLATVVMDEKNAGTSWFPLRVDYEERFYAAGRILGSQYMRREGRPSEEAVLSGRIVDRTIRPLFDQRIRNEIQVVITVLSIGDEDPDVVSVNAASLALATSSIPWNGPVSAVRVGAMKNNGEFSVNPSYEYRADENVLLDVLVCGKDGNITMIEVGANEASEEKVLEALEEAQRQIEKLQAWQKEIVAGIGKEKRVLTLPEVPSEIVELFSNHIGGELDDILFGRSGKSAIKELEEKWGMLLDEYLPESDRGQAFEYLNKQIDEAVHRGALERNARVDGRGMDELRPLFAQAGGISTTHHGAGLFYRGQTHVLSVLTLGGPDDALIIDGMEVQNEKRFFHHYNFPPFSTGEVGRIGGFNRREIGHGALAEKALKPVLPPKEEFPYTIRIVSEALSSNGSTSMASVCGGTLALMDAGVPITRPVAGIAMGVVIGRDGSYKVLTDIQGPEDHHGDMDFKVAGTSEGVNAVQMDVKVEGVPLSILKEGLEKAKAARLQILDVITEAIPSPRTELSEYAPRIDALKIRQDQIGEVIGSGGKTVNEIRDATGTEISIEDDGMVYITGKHPGVGQAKEMILSMTREYTAGEKFEGVVTKVADFGAFVKIGYNKEGLVHVSEIGNFRVEKVSDFLKEGDKVPVVLKEVDERGRLSLSIKKADPDFIKPPQKDVKKEEKNVQ